MTVLNVTDVALEHFRTETLHERQEVVVRLHGNADSGAREGLRGLLDQVDTAAVRMLASAAVIDLSDLYFMNSSCLSILVRWINALSVRKPLPYKLRLLSNAGLRWQRRSLTALAALAPDAVSVESVTG